MVRCKSVAGWLMGFVVAVMVTACGGGGGGGGGGSAAAPAPGPAAGTYTVSGTVTGLTGTGLVLQNNGGDNLTLSTSGAFSFKTSVANGAAYAVTVLTQPSGPTQICSVSSGSGTISGANITNVSVACAATGYTVSGTVSGLAGTGLVLQDNGGNNLAVSANGAFTFTAPIANGANYNVTVLTQPGGPVQTCSVGSGAGTIAGANITNVSVTCTTMSYTVGGTVNGLVGTGLVLQDNGGDNLSIAANGAFTFTTPLLGGAAYNVTVLTQPSGPAQTCSVIGGTGTVLGANISGVSVYCYSLSTPRYAFVVSSNLVWSYVVDAASGRLKYISTATPGTTPTDIAVDPAGKYVYVTNGGSNTVSQYTIGSNGVLNPMVPATVATGPGPVKVTVDPTGKYVYVANSNAYTGVPGSVSEYAIGATGALTPVGAGVIAAGLNTSSVTVDPTGRYLYVTNYNAIQAGTISQYAIGAGGVLTPMVTPSITTTSNPNSLAIDPTGQYAYISGNLNGAATGTYVMQYSIGASGSLSATPTATFLANGVGPLYFAFDPSGQNLYVATSNSNYVTQFVLGANGNLTTIGGTVAAGMSPRNIIVDPSGKYAYAVNWGNQIISQYTIGANGALTPNAVANVLGPDVYDQAIVMTHGAVPVQAVPQYAYVANYGGNTVSQFTIGATGSLTQMAPSTVAAGSGPMSVVVDSSSLFAYVANFLGNTVSEYVLGAGGGLAPNPLFASIPTGTGPSAIAEDPFGRFVYTVNSGANTVSLHTAGSGWLGGGTAYPAGTSPQSVVAAPSGSYVYVANAGSNDVSAYSVVPSTRTLVSISCGAPGTAGCSGAVAPTNFAAGTTPQSVTIDPSGFYVYVANKGGNTVSQYIVGATGGLMATASVAAGATPVSVTIDPSGKYAYVANSFNGAGGNSVSQYTIGMGGALTPMIPASVAAGTGPQSVTVDVAGKFAYVTNKLSNDISVYTLGAGGTLTQVVCAAPAVCSAAIPANFAAGATPATIVTTGTRQ